MRYGWMAVLGATLVFGLLGIVSNASANEEACPNTGTVCDWTNTSFKGTRAEILCTGGAHPLNFTKFSVKDRCPNKAAWTRVNGVALNCVNAGGQIEVAEFNELWIGAEGSHCP